MSAGDIREALTAAGASPLVQKRIDPVLLEVVRRYSPLMYSIPTKSWDSTTYWFNTRTVLPQGGPVTDGGARAVSTSTYIQGSFVIKLFQLVGAVTGYAQAVTRGVIGDLKAREIQGATKSLTWSQETWVLWGSAAATALGVQPGFDGFDALCATFSGASQNALDKDSDSANGFALKYLDELMDLVEENVAAPIAPDYMFVMSPKANSRIAQLLTNQQRFVGETQVAAGLTVPTYRDVAIVKSSFLAARSQQMGTVTPSTATTGGTIAAGTQRYQVSAVIDKYGEIAASTEVSQVTTGATSTVTLAITTPTGPDGAPPILYKVFWTNGATGTETLLGIVDAFDTTGAAVTSIIDTGTNLLTNSAANTGPAAYVATNTGTGPLALASSTTHGNENIYLVPKNDDFLVRPYVRDLGFEDLAATTQAPDTLPFFGRTDTTLALRAPKYMGRLARVNVAAL